MNRLFGALVHGSLHNRLFVLVAAAVMVAYGLFELTRMPVDVFPDLNRPMVTLMTEAEGMAPEEVEQLVTYPLETAMNGMPGVTRVRALRTGTELPIDGEGTRRTVVLPEIGRFEVLVLT